MQKENPQYLTEQLITYIGNKRALIPFISKGIEIVQQQLGRTKLDCLDVFSGSGIVSRCLKGCSRSLAVNDLELYAQAISSCYLANKSEIDLKKLEFLYEEIKSYTENAMQEFDRLRAEGCRTAPGFISELYAPANAEDIKSGERCFYTPYNANYIDVMRQQIARTVPEAMQLYFIAPLLTQASVHANTAGIFKGFYKNSETGIGQFGGNGKNALGRIRGRISMPFPLFSAHECPVRIFRAEANALSEKEELYAGLPDGSFDLAYIDPPYNQHPYGSNYFMLNLITSYERPDSCNISRVSGIPRDWNRSAYNKRKIACDSFTSLAENLRAKFLLISFNSEGFISRSEMTEILKKFGDVTVLESPYNTFRGSRNLKNRKIHVSEYLFIVRKK